MRRTLALTAALVLLLAGSARAEDAALSLVDVTAPVPPVTDPPARRILAATGIEDPILRSTIERASAAARSSSSATSSQIVVELGELAPLLEETSRTALKLANNPADPMAGLDLVDSVGEATLRLGRLASLTVGQGPAAQRAAQAVRRYTAGALGDLRKLLHRRQVAAASACPLTGDARQTALSALGRQVRSADGEVDGLLEALTVADGPAGIVRLYEARDLTSPLACAPMADAAEAGRWGQAAIHRLRSAFSACTDVQLGAIPA